MISRGIGAATWSVVDAMPNIVSKPAQLPEELGMYVDGLRRTYPAIDEVWVLGPRDDEERHRRWDLLAFADEDALAAIRANRSVHRADLRLTIVTDGDRFERAWGAPRSGRLSSIRWRVEDLHSASYIGDGAVRETAVRVR